MEYSGGILTKTGEIDIGFILRATNEVRDYIKQHINWNIEGDDDHHDFIKLTLLQPENNLYGLELSKLEKVFLCTLVDIPTVIECMKTLD